MLVIWTAADASAIKAVVGPVLKGRNIPHQICSDMKHIPPGAGPGDVILACGTKAIETLQLSALVPKNRTVTSLREKPVQHKGATIFVTYDPGICSRDYARLPEVQWDIQLSIRMHQLGTMQPKIGDYRYVESLHELIERIEEKYEKTGRPVDVSCDLETKSLNPYDPKAWIISCFFTVDKGKSDGVYFEKGEAPIQPLPWKEEDELDYWEGLWVQFHWLLTSPKVLIRGANFKYDSKWLTAKWGITCTNHKLDTMLIGSLLDENRSNSLKLHAKIYTDMGGYEDEMDKYDFGSLEEVPKEELLRYAGGDTDVTQQVADVMRSELLKDGKLANFYVKLLHPSSIVFAKMELGGVLVDLDYYHQLQGEVEAEVVRLRAEMLECLPNKLRIKYMDDIAQCMEEEKSPFKPKLLKEFLFSPSGLNLEPMQFTEKTREPSTSMDHLMMFEDNPVATKFIELFKELGSAQKTLSTYIVGFLKHLHPDSRFHSTYMLHRGDYGGSNVDSGTNTGRTSAKDPAIQTVPKHSKWAKRLRKAYIAPPGYSILNCDFSQGELRITAVVADEPTMIEAYANGADLHAITAAQLNGYSFEDFMLLPEDLRDELRSGGKAGNFGLIYGMQHKGFREYAFTTYGVSMTEEEAFQKREAFFGLYTRLPAWHTEYINHAHAWGFVRSPLGRVRHLPLINSKDRDIVAQSERQSINSPIQSCLSDMMQLAMVHIDREYGSAPIQMFLMCHDALSLYVPTSEEVMWAKRVKEVMENLPLKKDFGWDSPLKFIADAEVGPNLAELKKLKGL